VGIEPGIRQREIVGLRIAFADSELVTKYTLPFVDGAWKVPFVVLDTLGRPPAVLVGPVHLERSRLRTTAHVEDLQGIESIPASAFSGLVHYDPWWAFRGVSGVNRSWIEAIFATNIARPFRYADRTWKIHDLVFADGIGHLDSVVAKDEFFRAKTFGQGDLDLLTLRPTEGNETSAPRASPAAKAL